MVTEVNQSDFHQAMEGLALVDFWAPWCGPCKKMAPVFEKLSAQYGEHPKFFKVNVDDNPELAERHGVSGIPCLILLRNGKELYRIVGYYPEDALKQKIDEGVALAR